MCVRTIVDASAFRHVCEPTRNSAGDQLRRWISRGDGVVVYSPEHTEYADELKKYTEIRELLLDYNQRGLALHIDATLIQKELDGIPGRPVRQSNDPHILALAAASRATVLFSCDGKLRHDFAINHQVLSNVGQNKRRSVPDLRDGVACRHNGRHSKEKVPCESKVLFASLTSDARQTKAPRRDSATAQAPTRSPLVLRCVSSGGT